MQLGPRHYIVQEARIEFARFWMSFLEKYDLTMTEFLAILNGEVQSVIHVMLNEERNFSGNSGPDSGRQADGD